MFGLFVVVSGATIKNVILSNVDKKDVGTLDGVKYYGDNIGAVVGYSTGSVTIKDCEVKSGSIAGCNVGGIIGRAYGYSSDAEISIDGCVNRADISASGDTNNKSKAAGIVGYFNGRNNSASVSVNGCENYGIISSSASTASIAAGIAIYGLQSSNTDNYTIIKNVNNARINVATENTGSYKLYAHVGQETFDGKGTDDTFTVFGNTITDGSKIYLGAETSPASAPLVRATQDGSDVN